MLPDETQFAAFAAANDGKVVYIDGDEWTCIDLDDDGCPLPEHVREGLRRAVAADAGVHFFALVKQGDKVDVHKYAKMRAGELIAGRVERVLADRRGDVM